MTDTLPARPYPPEEFNPDNAHVSSNEEQFMHDAAASAENVIMRGVYADAEGMEHPKPYTIPDKVVHDMVIQQAKSVHRDHHVTAERDYYHDESRFDEKTGMSTEKVMNEDLMHALALAYREKKGVVLVEIDGSGLKAVNDEHTSLAGDHLIQATAKGIKSRVRKQDRAYRRSDGSDEFYVLMPFIQLDKDSSFDFFAQYRKGLEAAVQKAIDQDEELRTSPKRDLMGVSIGIGWVDFSDEDPRHEIMSRKEVAEELLSMASADRNKNKEEARNARNEARLEAGEEIPSDERLQ